MTLVYFFLFPPLSFFFLSFYFPDTKTRMEVVDLNKDEAGGGMFPFLSWMQQGFISSLRPRGSAAAWVAAGLFLTSADWLPVLPLTAHDHKHWANFEVCVVCNVTRNALFNDFTSPL